MIIENCILFIMSYLEIFSLQNMFFSPNFTNNNCAAKFHLPNIHQIVGCPAEYEPNNKDARDLDGVHFRLPDDSAIVYLPPAGGGEESGLSPADEDDDSEVTEDHHEEGQEPREAEHEHEVEELLRSNGGVEK